MRNDGFAGVLQDGFSCLKRFPEAFEDQECLAVCRQGRGFELLATGMGPSAARVSGRIRVGRVIGFALLWSGMLAGLAGGIEVGGVSHALFQNLSPGYGFSAI